MDNSKRYVGLDVSRGFGIIAMILIHGIIQQVAEYDGSIFIPHFQNLSKITLILLAPIALLGLFGPAFVFITSITISIQMIALSKKKPDSLGVYVYGRVIIGLILIILNNIANTLFGAHFFRNGKFFLPEFQIRYDSNIIDSIAWSGIIISFFLFLFLRFRKNINFIEISIIFLTLVVLWFVCTPFLIPVGVNVFVWADEHSMYILKYIVSKFVIGRFKLFPVTGFGFLGIIYGYFLYSKSSFKKILIFSLILAAVSITIFLIFVLFDSSFINDFASEDVPLQLQILCMGLIPLIIIAFMKGPDFSSLETRYRRASKTTWMRRYSIISLTAFSIGTIFADWIFHFFTAFWGNSVDRTGTVPKLEWNFFQVIAFIITLFLFWELCVRLWEKIDYKGSLEWFMSVILSKFFHRETSRMNIEKILYHPNKPPQTAIEGKE